MRARNVTNKPAFVKKKGKANLMIIQLENKDCLKFNKLFGKNHWHSINNVSYKFGAHLESTK